MGPTQTSPPKKAAASVAMINPHKKTGLPPRKIKASPTQKKNVRKPSSSIPILTVTRFTHPLSLEMFTYTKGGNDGFLNELVTRLNGDGQDETLVPPSQALQDGNFHSCPFRRKPNSANENLRGANGYYRRVILRYPPENESTPETRQIGLTILSTFLKDPLFNRYPPPVIELIDETNEQNLPALDDFFMDDTIKEIMQEDVEASHLNASFFNDYHDFAIKCWGHPFISTWASSLGFPRT